MPLVMSNLWYQRLRRHYHNQFMAYILNMNCVFASDMQQRLISLSRTDIFENMRERLLIKISNIYIALLCFML